MSESLAARWQDHCLDVKRTKGCPPEACSPVAASGLSGGSSLSGIKVTHQQADWTGMTNGFLADGSSPQTTDSASVGSVNNTPRNRDSPEATAADDCQFLHDLFPEVVAEASAEAENPAVKASSRASLGLKLDHTEVLRALDRQKSAALGPPGNAVTCDIRLSFLPAKAALEATCGPLPTYDMEGAAAAAPPMLRRMCSTASVTPFTAPLAAAMSVAVPLSSLSGTAGGPARRSPSPPTAGTPAGGRGQGGPATLQPASSLSLTASSGSAVFSSAFLQANTVATVAGQPALPASASVTAFSQSSSATGSGSYLQLPAAGDHSSTMGSDLGDLVASFQKDGGQDDFGPLFLSDSEDASDGTQLSLGRMWGGPDVFDGIFDDVDAMDSDSYGSHFDPQIPDGGMMLGSSPPAGGYSASRMRPDSALVSKRDAAGSCGDNSPPLMGAASGGSPQGRGIVPVMSCGDLIHHGLGETPGGCAVSRALLLGGPHMPTIPRCASTLLLRHIPVPADMSLTDLPASLVQIPAKTTECAKSARAACFAKCKEKRQNRQSGKIRYEMRKINAEKRPRIKVNRNTSRQL